MHVFINVHLNAVASQHITTRRPRTIQRGNELPVLSKESLAKGHVIELSPSSGNDAFGPAVI